jgi:hypothetical protein
MTFAPQVSTDYSKDPHALEGPRLAEQKQHKPSGRDPQPVQSFLPWIAEYTPTIKLNPSIGLAALPSFEHVRPGMGGAWRAWVLARSLDTEGSGRVSRKDLRNYLSEIGANTRTFDTWIGHAVTYGLLREGRSKRDGRILYYLVSEGKAAKLCGCEVLSPRAAWIPAEILITKNWKAFVFVAWRSQYKYVSQTRVQELTGIHRRTQSRYLGNSQAIITKNYVRYNRKVSQAHVNGLRDIEANYEEGSRAYYQDSNDNLSKHLPDSVENPAEVKTHNRVGRTRKAQKELRQALRDDPETCDKKAQVKRAKVFCETDKELKKAQRSYSKLPAKDKPEETYIRNSKGERLQNWGVIFND